MTDKWVEELRAHAQGSDPSHEFRGDVQAAIKQEWSARRQPLRRRRQLVAAAATICVGGLVVSLMLVRDRSKVTTPSDAAPLITDITTDEATTTAPPPTPVPREVSGTSAPSSSIANPPPASSTASIDEEFVDLDPVRLNLLNSIEVADDELRLIIAFTGAREYEPGNHCSAQYRVDVDESTDVVDVNILGRSPIDPGEGCRAIGYERVAIVDLDAPLGDRIVRLGGDPIPPDPIYWVDDAG